MERPVEIRRRDSLRPPPPSPLDKVPNGTVLTNGEVFSFSTSQEENAEETETVLAVNCRVCQAEIIIETEEGFVVKCDKCGEATPIRNAPVGEKYVRCPCHCLLICKDTSNKIACPRPHCKRIITISATNASTTSFATQQSTPGTILVSCAHCQDNFLFNVIHNSLASCPHCQSISAVGNRYRMRQIKVYLLVSALFFLLTFLVIFGTAFLLEKSAGIVALYIGLSAMTLLAIVRVIYFLRMKVSKVQGEA